MGEKDERLEDLLEDLADVKGFYQKQVCLIIVVLLSLCGTDMLTMEFYLCVFPLMVFMASVYEIAFMI